MKINATAPDGRVAEIVGDIPITPLQQQRFESVMAKMGPGESKLVEGFKITMGAPPPPPPAAGGGWLGRLAGGGQLTPNPIPGQPSAPYNNELGRFAGAAIRGAAGMALAPVGLGLMGLQAVEHPQAALKAAGGAAVAAPMLLKNALQSATQNPPETLGTLAGGGLAGLGLKRFAGTSLAGRMAAGAEELPIVGRAIKAFRGMTKGSGGAPGAAEATGGTGIPPAPPKSPGGAPGASTAAPPKSPGGAPGASTAPSSRVPGKDMGPVLQRFQDMLKADQGATGTPNLRAGGQAKTLAELASQLATEQGAPAGTKVTAIKQIPMVGGKGTPADLRQVQNILADMLKDPGRFPPKYQAILKEIKDQGGKATPEQLALLAGAMGGLAYAGKKVYDKVKQGGQTVNKSLNSFQRYSDLMKDAGQQP